MSSLTPVIAAVIRREELVLLCHRPSHKRHGDLWEFPGGKVEEGETLLEAATRELEEELGVRAAGIGQSLLDLHDPGSEFLIQFIPVEIEGEPTALEHQNVAWVTPEDLLAYPLAPSDRKFAESWVPTVRRGGDDANR